MIDAVAWAICPHIKRWADKSYDSTSVCQKCPAIEDAGTEHEGTRLCRLNAQDAAEDAMEAMTGEIAALTREREIYRAAFIKANQFCNDYAVHLHIRGGALAPVDECIAAQRLLDGGL